MDIFGAISIGVSDHVMCAIDKRRAGGLVCFHFVGMIQQKVTCIYAFIATMYNKSKIHLTSLYGTYHYKTHPAIVEECARIDTQLD